MRTRDGEKQTIREAYWDRKNELAATLAKLELSERQYERLEADYESLRTDHRRLVDQMTALVHGRSSGSLKLDRDPFAEDAQQPDEWLHPALDEIEALNPDAILDAPAALSDAL